MTVPTHVLPGEGIVLATGGLALLPRALSGLLRPTYKESREVWKGWGQCGCMWESVTEVGARAREKCFGSM